MSSLTELKIAMGTRLIAAERLNPHPGVSTGWRELDEFVAWRGLPKTTLSLFLGARGFGATHLWLQAAARVTQAGQWCAWIDDDRVRLCPWTLRQAGVELKRLVVVEVPREPEKFLWALHELLSLGLFELVGADVTERRLRAHQLVKLQRQVQRATCALVLVTEALPKMLRSLFALVVEFQGDGVHVTRALHRPTPQLLPRRDVYADLMPQLVPSRAAGDGRDLSDL